jgi:hypothetical protein
MRWKLEALKAFYVYYYVLQKQQDIEYKPVFLQSELLINLKHNEKNSRVRPTLYIFSHSPDLVPLPKPSIRHITLPRPLLLHDILTGHRSSTRIEYTRIKQKFRL